MPAYKDYALQKSQNESFETPHLQAFLPTKLDSVAAEMTEAYRGRSKRMAFNALLRSVNRASIKRFPSRFFKTTGDVADDVQSKNENNLSPLSGDRAVSKAISVEDRDSGILQEEKNYEYSQKCNNHSQILPPIKRQGVPTMSLAPLKIIVEKSNLQHKSQSKSSPNLTRFQHTQHEWSDFIAPSDDKGFMSC